MPAFIEGVLRIVENATFKDMKTGSDVPYFKNYIQDADGKMLTLGSRDNHTDMVGREAVFTIEIREAFGDAKGHRVSLKDVKPV